MLMAISSREHKRGQRLDKFPRVPFPEGDTFTVRAVALRFHRSPKRIYNLLYEHAARFSSHHYQVYLGRGDRRFYRLITEADMLIFREIFSTRVK